MSFWVYVPRSLRKFLLGQPLTDGTLDAIRASFDPSAEEAARLFERGYRGTHAGHSQGGGIGLSIVSRLCALYGWEVGVRPGESKGVVATLRFSPTREASAATPARA